MWRRPVGVAPGTWDYVHQRAIADHYDDFVADTPLCTVDSMLVAEIFPGVQTPDGGGGGQSILDLGAGSGRIAIPLAERGYDVVAVDLSQPMLEVLSKKSISQETCGDLLPLRANLVQLDMFADNSVDHAVCMFATLGMIQGSDHRKQLLRHAHRIVRPGGTIVVHVHNRWAALCERHPVRTLAASWWKSLCDVEHEFGDSVYGYRGLDAMFMHRFSRVELVRLLTSNRWKLERCLRLSIDGSQCIEGFAIAGGFIAVATCAK